MKMRSMSLAALVLAGTIAGTIAGGGRRANHHDEGPGGVLPSSWQAHDEARAHEHQ